TESLIDRFASYYTPTIIVLAVGAYLVTQNALLALTLLVIGCPGALVIGPPVSIVSAIGNAARSGVLMKGGEHLERAGKIDLVAFDKTGTLTAGETSVTNVHGFDYDDGEALRLAAIAEKKSEHHLAGAILDAARSPDDAVIADGGTYVDGPERMVDRRADGETVAERTAVPDPERFTVAAG